MIRAKKITNPLLLQHLLQRQHRFLLQHQHQFLLQHQHQFLLQHQHQFLLQRQHRFLLQRQHRFLLQHQHRFLLQSPHLFRPQLLFLRRSPQPRPLLNPCRSRHRSRNRHRIPELAVMPAEQLLPVIKKSRISPQRMKSDGFILFLSAKKEKPCSAWLYS